MHSKLRTTLIAAPVLLLTLAVGRADVPTAEQDCRNRKSALCETAGVEFLVDGPCPATARTVRPQGVERCDDLAPPVTRASIPTPSGDVAARPELVLVGAVLAVGIAAWAFRRRYRNRDADDSTRSAGQSVMQSVAAAMIAVLVAWKSAGAAFNHTFGSFDNHDTAAPLLIAAPVAFAVFVLVALLAFAASKWVLRVVGGAFGKRP
jgi:hypothetical protein